MIHSARVSLTVVAICNASWPYAAPAPTTELVSCMAIAAHMPNCCWLSPSASPTGGKTNRATALRTNIVISDSDICSVVVGIYDRTDSRNSTAAADRRARRNQIGAFAVDAHSAAERHAQQHDAYDRYHRKEHAVATGRQRLVQVHAEAYADHRGLQGDLGCTLGKCRVGIAQSQCEHYARQQRHSRREKGRCGQQDEKQCTQSSILVHGHCSFSRHSSGISTEH